MNGSRKQSVGVMSRDLISHDSNRSMASRAADSRWDRGILTMTKGAATGRGRKEAFVGVVRGWTRRRGEEVVRGKSDKKLWSRKEEPAGNLKGKFAGWIALVGVISARFSPSRTLAGWLSTAAPSTHQLASAISPLPSFSCRLSFSLPVSQNGFPPGYSLH